MAQNAPRAPHCTQLFRKIRYDPATGAVFSAAGGSWAPLRFCDTKGRIRHAVDPDRDPEPQIERLIYRLVTGITPTRRVVTINGNALDLAWENLHLLTETEHKEARRALARRAINARWHPGAPDLPPEPPPRYAQSPAEVAAGAWWAEVHRVQALRIQPRSQYLLVRRQIERYPPPPGAARLTTAQLAAMIPAPPLSVLLALAADGYTYDPRDLVTAPPQGPGRPPTQQK